MQQNTNKQINIFCIEYPYEIWQQKQWQISNLKQIYTRKSKKQAKKLN